MANEDIRCIIKCLINFQDGNCEPPEVKKDEILNVTEGQFHRLSKSGPKHFELIRRDFLVPKKQVEIEEWEPTPDYQAALDADGDILIDPLEDVEEWKPIPWYAAQLAREPASAEA